MRLKSTDHASKAKLSWVQGNQGVQLNFSAVVGLGGQTAIIK